VICVKTAEPIEMPFGVWTRVSPKKDYYVAVHICASWRIRLNHSCAEAMRPLWNNFDHLFYLFTNFIIKSHYCR